MNDQEPLAHSAKNDKGIPAQTYVAHITGVVKRAQKNVSVMATYFSGAASLLVDVVSSAAFMHDLGKLDKANQEALSSGGKKSLPTNHVDAGTALLCKQGNKESALLVLGHHIGLCSIPHEVTRGTLFLRDGEVYEHTDKFLADYVNEHKRWCCQDSRPRQCVKTGLSALDRRFLFSCLVDGDHGDTAHNYEKKQGQECSNDPRWEERIEALDEYVSRLGKKNIGQNRNAQRQQIYMSSCEAIVENTLYTCDSAVGSGKTTAVMAYLLRAAQKNGLRHIFVILPYTNIIKQSVEVYREALVLPGENPEKVVAELHHQADFSNENLRQYAALWTAPIIVTTAVQFFETLGGNRPGQTRKLHELPGSAIFVDEAHAVIPSYLWPQAWRWLKELRNKWRCNVVLASGSLPKFWTNRKVVDQEENAASLIAGNISQAVHDAEGSRVIYKTEAKLLDADALINFINSKPGPRLVVLNTVQSAAVLADKMRAQRLKVMHLSTALTPCDRNRIINKIQRCLGNREKTDWTLVATSCVEAGMDFSFSTAFRESCSAASLIQIGGRVNRHNEREKAEVWDFRISDHMMLDNPQLSTSQSVLRRLFEEKYFENKTATEIVTKALEMELMSDFGDFACRSQEIIRQENQNDFPLVAKLCRVIDSDTRMIIISPDIVKAIKSYEKVDSTEIIKNSVQIRFYKIKSAQFKSFCESFHADEEFYCWRGKYDGGFLGYMAAIVPLLQLDADSFSMV